MDGLRFGINLDAKGIFNEKCLIYTIRDEHGSPIAFSARNLKYESEKETYEQKRAKIEARADLDELQKKEEVEKLWVPRKYINTAETILFQKRCVLFNFDQAKKSSNKSIVVFEGNADCTTLFSGGIKMAVATCGTAFTTEHLDMVLAHGITKIVLVFDPDKGGKEGTARFIKMLEEFGSRPGLEVEIVVMPGTSDPDDRARAVDQGDPPAKPRQLPGQHRRQLPPVRHARHGAWREQGSGDVQVHLEPAHQARHYHHVHYGAAKGHSPRRHTPQVHRFEELRRHLLRLEGQYEHHRNAANKRLFAENRRQF
jgi:hypothetical protein